MLLLQTAAQNGGAKDGEAKMSLVLSGGLVAMERVAGGRVARPQSLASAGAADGDSVCQRPSHGDDVVARRRRQRRLPRLLLLPRRRGTQERIDCDAALGAGAAKIVLAGARAVGDRRFAH